MLKSRLSWLLLGASILPFTAPALGQEVESVVVTGSRVARQGFETPTPMTAISTADLEAKQAVTVTDIIAEIPSLAPNQNVNNSQNVGLSQFNLRNIGANRTLVLLDGLRVEDTSPTANGFNVNVIPAALINKIEIVTGGASAAYGSDAITGVVNIGLTNEMQGGKIDFQGTTSNYGDDRQISANMVYGHDFFGGKLHWVFAGSYYDQPNIIYESARPWGRQGYTMFTNTKAAIANGAPTYTIAPGGSLTNITYGGVIVNGFITNPVTGKDVTTNPAGFRYQQFLAGGQVAPYNPGGLCGGSSYCQNGDGVQTQFTPAGDLLPQAERYNLYSKLTFDLTPTTSVFASILYSSDDEIQTNVPNYNNGDLRITADNYYIPASVKQQMTANGLSGFLLGRENLEDGTTINNAQSTYMRYVLGAQGVLPWVSGWTWDAHAAYTQAGYYNSAQNNRNQTKFFNSVDAVANPAVGGVPGVAAGAPVCRSTIANPTNGCVPADLFGTNTISQSALAYYRGTSWVQDGSNQINFGVNARGDLFSTWAGPISGAIGGEYRRDSINQYSDDVSHTLGWRQASAQPFYGANEVREGYAEVVVPLTIPGVPLMDKLELDTAARIADYDSSGAAFTWKAGLNWTLDSQLRFRTTYSRDFRAPSVNDLYSTPLISNGATVNDTVRTINGAPNPNLNGNPTIQTLSGGNPDLRPETAKTLTAGFVISPDFLPGFTLSVDSFNINMGNAITTFSVQNVVDNCNLGSQTFCDAITRNGAGVITKVQAKAFNAQTLKVNGVDIEASYTVPLEDVWNELDGTFTISNLASYAEHITTSANGVQQENAGFLTGNNVLPNWRSSTSFVYNDGPLTARVLWYYTGPGRYSATIKTPADINLWHVSGRSYFDLSTQYDLTERVEVYGKINNALNQDPPMLANNATLKALANSSSLYDSLGRIFGLGVRYKW